MKQLTALLLAACTTTSALAQDPLTISNTGEVFIPNLRVGTLVIDGRTEAKGKVTVPDLEASGEIKTKTLVATGSVNTRLLGNSNTRAGLALFGDIKMQQGKFIGTMRAGDIVADQLSAPDMNALRYSVIAPDLAADFQKDDCCSPVGAWMMSQERVTLTAKTKIGNSNSEASVTQPSLAFTAGPKRNLFLIPQAMIDGIPNALGGLVAGQFAPVTRSRNNVGTFNFNVPSDRRLKTDIVALSAAGTLVDRLAPVTYRMTDPELVPGGDGRQIGFIADEVESLFPELVYKGEDGYRRMRYGQMTAVLTRALQETRAELREAKAELAAERARMDAIEARLSELERAAQPAAYRLYSQ